jgi:hypothetical protein
MPIRFFGCVLVILATIAVAGVASAGEYRAHGSKRVNVREAPIKDCTRYNGRWGYYGNPWCTLAEQDRWDRWSAEPRRYR